MEAAGVGWVPRQQGRLGSQRQSFSGLVRQNPPLPSWDHVQQPWRPSNLGGRRAGPRPHAGTGAGGRGARAAVRAALSLPGPWSPCGAFGMFSPLEPAAMGSQTEPRFPGVTHWWGLC